MSAPTFLNSIALLRAIAVSLVVYAHLVGRWIQFNPVDWLPERLIRTYLIDPFHIWLHGGALGVAIFFMVSGFIIPYAAEKENRVQFLVKRFFRIYPVFFVSILFLLGLKIFMSYFDIPATAHFIFNTTPFRLSMSFTMLDFLFNLTPHINGVAWTLVRELIFYGWIFLLISFFYEKPHSVLLLTLILMITTVLLISKGVYVVRFVNTISYFFLGTLIYYRWSNRIAAKTYLLFSAIFWTMFMIGEAKLYDTSTVINIYINYGLGFFIFAGVVLLEKKIRRGAISTYISKTSYSIYLFHQIWGQLLLFWLVAVIGYTLSLAIALLTVGLISLASYRYIEAPAQKWARNYLGHRAPDYSNNFVQPKKLRP